MRRVETLPTPEKNLRRSLDGDQRLQAHISEEILDALNSRKRLEEVWRECATLYEACPKEKVRNTPVEGAPNIEVPLAAIAADAMYAMIVDLIHNTEPIISVRANHADNGKHARALQTFINRMVNKDVGFRMGTNNAYLDVTQMGTGVFYIPWAVKLRKTNTHRIVDEGPRIFSVPVEDFLVSPSYSDMEDAPWVAMRTYLTSSEMEQRERLRNWDISEAEPAPVEDWVRSRRERLAHVEPEVSRKASLYEVWSVHLTFDYNDDGEDEALLAIWDRTSGKLLAVDYDPFDSLPFESMACQRRAHMFYGIGPVEMLRGLQYEASEIHNARTLNALLASARMWVADEDKLEDPDIHIMPGGIIKVKGDPDAAIKPWPMSDQFASSFADENIAIGLSERRTGLGDLSLPRPSAVLGSRTPATTALTLTQSVNRRFAPIYDEARFATAAAVVQCLRRYHEQLVSNPEGAAARHILRVVGAKRAPLVLDVLLDPEFEQEYAVETTASSASVNREADKQGAMLMMNMLLSYYEKVLMVVQIASSPEASPPLRETARQIAVKGSEALERFLNTFEFVRDPSAFSLEMEGILSESQRMDQGELAGLSMFGGMFGAPGGEGAPQGGNGGNVRGVPEVAG